MRWRAGWVLGVTVAVGFLGRALVGVVHPYWFDDSFEYVALGQAILAGGDFQVGGLYASRMPGYPALIAGVLAIFGPGAAGVQALLVLQAGLGAGCCGLVYLLGRRASEGAGLVGAGLVAVDPLGVAFSGAVLSETAFTLLLLLAVWCMVRVWEEDGLRWWVALGGVGALAVYVRAEAFWLMIMLPLMAVWKLLSGWYQAPGWPASGSAVTNELPEHGADTAADQRLAAPPRAMQGEDQTDSSPPRPANERIAVVGLLLTVAIVMLMVAPWWVRNRAHEPTRGVWMTSLEGISLYEVVYAGADGGPRQDKPEIRAALAEMKAAGMTEGQRDREWKRRAWECMRAEPGRMVRLAAVKVGRMWSPGLNAPGFARPGIQAALWGWHVPVYGLAILGLWAGRRRFIVRVVLVPILYFAALHAVFMGSVRYRVPLMPLVELLAAWGVWWAWGRWREWCKRRRLSWV